MKKKILAAALALCLVLGLLPLSAMAKTWNLSYGEDGSFTLTRNAAGTYSSDDDDLNEYYTFTGVGEDTDGDLKAYYTLNKACGKYEKGSKGKFKVEIETETYDVKLDGNDSSVTLTGDKAMVETDTSGKLTALPAAPEDHPVGKMFVEWNTQADGKGTAVNALTYKNLQIEDDTTTLFAQWEVITTIIVFNKNADDANLTASQVTVKYGEKPAGVPVATRPGYTFDGWYTEADGGEKVDMSAAWAIEETTITLYAHWTADESEETTFTVHLDANGGKLTGEATVTTNTEHTLNAMPAEPTHDTLKYAGWNTQKDGKGDNVTTSYVFQEDNMTIYAQWTAEDKTVEVILDCNGGSMDGQSKVTYKTNAQGILESNPILSRDGYEFLGWFTAKTGGDKVDFSKPFTAKTTTIYAQWAPIVTFDPNGGTLYDSKEPVKVYTKDGKLGEDVKGIVPTRENYKFLGWFTDKTAGTEFNATATISAPATYYAHWGAIVHLHTGVGELSGEATVTTRADGTLAELPPAPKAPEATEEISYTFKGWFTAEKEGAEITTSTVLAGGATIYAQWHVSYTVVAEPTVKGGEAEAKVPELTETELENFADAFAKAQETAKEQGQELNSIKIAATAKSGGSSVKSAKASIPMKNMKAYETVDVPVVVETDRGTFEIDAEDVNVLAKLDGVTSVDVGIGEEKTPAKSVKAPAVKNKAYTYKAVVEVTLKDEKGKDISTADKITLSKGIKVFVEVVLDLMDGKRDAKVWYKPAKGDLVPETVLGYIDGKISWRTKHFSEYVFGTEETTTADNTSNKGGAGGAGGGGGSASSGYSVSVSKTTNGKVSVSPSKAEEGDTVTITVTPDKGYELDKLTVKDADGNTIKTTKKDDGKYTFTMPDGKVTIEATFKAIEEKETTTPAPTTPSFSDVPSSFWAYQQISWVAEKGIMGGYANGTFGANNNTTRQALWMVLGRLSGELDSKSTMAQAREWAIKNNISDGTNAEGAMSRQQMVTMLYRYAQMKGYATTGSTALSTYPDAAGVASYAQDALSWAVANGVVTGTTDGRLNPEGTASRAHFAVFMYRFCGLYDNVA